MVPPLMVLNDSTDTELCWGCAPFTAVLPTKCHSGADVLCQQMKETTWARWVLNGGELVVGRGQVGCCICA